MQPGTSSMIQGLAACCTGLEDPRETSRCDHQLIDILVIAVCAVIACAESWEDIALYGRSKQAWLATFLALPNGIPSHDTFRRVFMLIDPDAFERCFSRWVQAWAHASILFIPTIGLQATLRSPFSRGEAGSGSRNLLEIGPGIGSQAFMREPWGAGLGAWVQA